MEVRLRLTQKLLKNIPAYATCTLMIAILCAPILSISLQSNEIDTLATKQVAQDSLKMANLSGENFDASQYEIADYSRDEIVVANRSLDSEDLMFGSVELEDGEDVIEAPEDKTFTEDNKTVYVDVVKLNMREFPGLDAPIIKVYGFGDTFKRTGISQEWARVVNSSGSIGYVKADYVTTVKPVTKTNTPKKVTVSAPAKANTLGESIAKEAVKYLGVKYRGGQESPTSGFDCTGLTYYVFNRYGISTPRGSSSYYNAGIEIPYSQIAPGDVISWDTRKYDRRTTITHVGIYIGGGKMVHASSTNRKVVIVSVAQYREWGCKLLSVHRFNKK